MEKLHTTFSALNVDFSGPSLDLLGSRKPAHEGIKEQYSLEVVILPLLASLAWNWLQIGMLPITTSTSDELFSCLDINHFERPRTLKIRSFVVFCNLRLRHALQSSCSSLWSRHSRLGSRSCKKFFSQVLLVSHSTFVTHRKQIDKRQRTTRSKGLDLKLAAEWLTQITQKTGSNFQ